MSSSNGVARTRGAWARVWGERSWPDQIVRYLSCFAQAHFTVTAQEHVLGAVGPNGAGVCGV